jgi:hypothetical protein
LRTFSPPKGREVGFDAILGDRREFGCPKLPRRGVWEKKCREIKEKRE